MVSFCPPLTLHISSDTNHITTVAKKVREFRMKRVIGKNDDRRKTEAEKKKLEIKKKEKELVREVPVCLVLS